MSSPGSGELTLEIPPRLLADRATVGLVVACAVAIEAVAARYPEGPVGLGAATGVLLALWHGLWVRRSPTVVGATLDRAGRWRLRLSDGRAVAAVLQPGSRVLGSSVVLRWKTGRRVLSAWLTGWDLPPDRLRELTVRLLASGGRAGA
jgi:hypothetical protein